MHPFLKRHQRYEKNRRKLIVNKGGSIMGDAFDDYMDRMDSWWDDGYWYPDVNEQAVEVFYEYRVPDDQAPDKLE